jgi:hypothetical protein
MEAIDDAGGGILFPQNKWLPKSCLFSATCSTKGNDSIIMSWLTV